jgi:hypothetical protein
VQADRQSAVIVDAASPAKANMQWIKPDSLRADTVKKSVGATEQRNELATLHLIKLHLLPQPGNY